MRQVSRPSRLILAAALLVLLGALGGTSGPAGAGASRAPTTPAQGDIAVDVEVISVERLDHSTQLLLELNNTTNRTLRHVGLNDPAFGAIDNVRFNDLSGIRLFDEDENVEYLPFRNGEENLCICSRLDSMSSGATWTVWWRSAPLPQEVDTVSVLGPDGDVLAADVEVEG